MNQRILVTYATRAGSTAEVAAAIGESLAARGYAVEVKSVKEKPGVAGYSAVVLGSAIRYLNAVRPLLPGAEEVYFEGLMDFSRLSFLDRTISKMVKAVEADRRDWVAIRAWTPAGV